MGALRGIDKPAILPLMDSSSGHALGTARDVTPSVGRRRRRRRPTGEPPPLPRHLESTGVGWMVATITLIAVVLVVSTAGRYGRGISFAVVDNWVVQRLAEARTPGLTSLMRGVSGLLGSIWTVKVLAWGGLVVLVVYKRFRQLIVGLVSSRCTWSCSRECANRIPSKTCSRPVKVRPSLVTVMSG